MLKTRKPALYEDPASLNDIIFLTIDKNPSPVPQTDESVPSDCHIREQITDRRFLLFLL